MNYTEEQTSYIIEQYTKNPTKSTIESLSNEFSKSPKSIIGKLSREGVYRREVYRTKTGEDPITKVEIVQNIADALRIESERLEGLEKAPKGVLKQIIESLNGVVAGSETEVRSEIKLGGETEAGSEIKLGGETETGSEIEARQ